MDHSELKGQQGMGELNKKVKLEMKKNNPD